MSSTISTGTKAQPPAGATESAQKEEYLNTTGGLPLLCFTKTPSRHAPTDTSQPWLSWEEKADKETRGSRDTGGPGPHLPPLLCPTWKRPGRSPLKGKVCEYKRVTLETHMKIQLGSLRNSIPRVIPRTKDKTGVSVL